MSNYSYKNKPAVEVPEVLEITADLDYRQELDMLTEDDDRYDYRRSLRGVRLA
ncbi:hypothetical protein [Paenibacillus dendritiformis]|uniref:hypothetical protein n=1 Tax=Paenibacillus dendritiformis TaxID=130049 RepID=UPI00387E08BF